MSSFSSMLKYLRKKEKLTQQELADKTGISRSRINNYEQGLRQPDFETAEIFADYFNVDMDLLLGRDREIKGGDDLRGILLKHNKLIAVFDSLSEGGQEDLQNYADYLLMKEARNG